MLISVQELADCWKVSPKGVLHIGAHLAEEREAYLKVGWGPPFVWVEAQATKVAFLRDTLPDSDIIIHGAAWSVGNREIELRVTNNSQSSSVLHLEEHQQLYPQIRVVSTEQVPTIRIDELISNEVEVDFMALDIQGVELEALKGSVGLLPRIKWIYLEVNKRPIYTGCSLVKDIDVFLGEYGFKRIKTYWVHGAGWGDALYSRSELAPTLFETKLLMRTAKRISYLLLFFRWPHLLLSLSLRVRLKRLLNKSFENSGGD